MEKKREFIISAVYWLILLGIIFLTLKYAFPAVMPFIFGFLIAAVINPPVRTLAKRFDLKRKPTGMLILLIFYATIGMLATVIIVRLVVSIGELSKALPAIYRETIEPALGVVFEFLNRVAQRLDRVFGQGSGIFADDFGGFLTSVRNSLGSAVSDISMKLLSRISGFAAGIPGVVVQVLFAVISSFFFTLDFESILSYLKAHLPDSIVKLLSKIRGSSLKTLGRYARSYALIMLITFAELSLGLLLIGVKHPFAAAFAISMFDILPVLGTGGILVPWALVRLLCSDFKGFIGLLALWAVISVVRNIIEPKIVGKQVGLHPLATLISMYVGTKLFGVIGLFMLPIGLSVWISTKNEYEAKAPLDKNG